MLGETRGIEIMLTPIIKKSKATVLNRPIRSNKNPPTSKNGIATRAPIIPALEFIALASVGVLPYLPSESTETDCCIAQALEKRRKKVRRGITSKFRFSIPGFP